MLLDRISQIALIFFGVLLLVLLVLGLSVSCRETSADPFVTPTIAAGPGTPAVPPLDATIPGAASPTPTPGGATATPGDSSAIVQPEQSPTAAGATPIGGATPGVVGPTPAATPGSGMVPGATARHAVSRGEWLLQIARCYGASYNSILAANRIPNPDYILPGQVFTIPNIGSQGSIVGPPCVVAYTVVAGDTWDNLAQRYRTTAAILQRANPGALTPGRSIWVPRIP